MQGEGIHDEQSVKHVLPEYASQAGTEPAVVTAGIAVKVCTGAAARYRLCQYQAVGLIE